MILGPLLAVALTAAPPPGLAVMDFAVEGASTELASATNGLVVHELERLGIFRVTSSETTRVILGVERQRALLGCDSCSGANLSDLTSFKYLVTGKLSRTGPAKEPTYLLLMTLLEAGSPAPLSSVRLEAKGEEKLLQEVAANVVKLVGKLAAERQGPLVVSASETGAAVKIDDTQVGTTPLPGRLMVGAGPHLLTVEKEGFTAVKKEVRISPDSVVDESVRLVPSPDTIDAYQARATRMRVLAWVSTGLAVAGAGALVGGSLMAEQRYGDVGSVGTFQWHRAALLAGTESQTIDGQLVDHRAAAGTLKAEIETWQTVAFIGLGTAAAGALAATVFFVIGDPPGKYDAYREQPRVSLTLTPGLGGAVLSGSF